MHYGTVTGESSLRKQNRNNYLKDMTQPSRHPVEDQSNVEERAEAMNQKW